MKLALRCDNAAGLMRLRGMAGAITCGILFVTIVVEARACAHEVSAPSEYFDETKAITLFGIRPTRFCSEGRTDPAIRGLCSSMVR
jgi:hypothetical protein